MRPSVPKTALMAFGSAIFVVAAGGICVGWIGSWVVDFPERVAEMHPLMLILSLLVTLPIFLICFVGVIFFGYGAVFFLGQLVFFWRPILEIGPDGVLDRASGVSVGFVPWEEVKSVEPYSIRGHRSITIRVKNERELLARQNPLKRLLMKVNRRYFGTGEINIPLNVLAISDEELSAELANYMGLRGKARERLKFGADTGVPGRKERPVDARTRALRIAKSVVSWTVLVLLSLIYLVGNVGFFMPGVMFSWNSIGPGSAPGLDRPVAGVILLVLGILFFVFFPRLVKRLTGHEVLS